MRGSPLPVKLVFGALARGSHVRGMIFTATTILATVSTAAGAVCKPVPATTWEHTFPAVGGVYASVFGLGEHDAGMGASRRWWTPYTNVPQFPLQECSWRAADAGEGVDGVAFDVGQHEDLSGTLKWEGAALNPQTGNPNVIAFNGVSVHFYGANCVRQSHVSAVNANQSVPFKFPSDVKWAFVEPDLIGAQTKVTLSSSGRKCA